MIRTLIIEDDPIITDQLVSYLRRIPEFERAGIARTGRQGRELAARVAPDRVLLDFTLPDMTGFDVWRYLRDAPLSTSEIGAAVGRCRVVAARYLDHPHRQGLVTLSYRCGGTGHPVHLYRLR